MVGSLFIMQSRTDAAVVQTLVWAGVLVVAVVLLSIAVMWMRRRLFGADRGGALGVDEVRAMKEQLTDQEYELLRAAAKRRLMQQVGAGGGGEAPGPAPPARAKAATLPPPELRAPPGLDLTGAPLPPNSKPPPGDAR